MNTEKTLIRKEKSIDRFSPIFEMVGKTDRTDDFEKVCASAITSEELKLRMHQRIDAWPWKEK